MSEVPRLLVPSDQPFGQLSPWSPGSPIGDVLANAQQSANSSNPSPTANLALFYGIMVGQTCTITGFGWFNGATVSGNVDCGIYDSNQNLLTHTGSVAQTGVSVFQGATATSVTIHPGWYYLAMVMDNVTGIYQRNAALTTGLLRASGCAQMATAFPLPSTATFASIGQSIVWLFGAQIQSVM